MKSKRISWGLSLALLLAVAAGIGGLAYAAGTALSISFGTPSVVCNGDGTATVKFTYTVSSTGAADAATVSGQLDDGIITNIATIADGNVNDGGGWTFAGRNKTYTGSVELDSVSEGSHTYTVCADQNGSGGNPNKHACNSITLSVDCASGDSCSNTAVFGELPHNTNLCSANGQIEVQFHGDFGDTANLTITGPNSFSFSTTVNKAGDSCNYHYNWNPRPTNATPNPGTGNGGAGQYTFLITAGSGGTSGPLSITPTLSCE
jgi:hypothetical protein